MNPHFHIAETCTMLICLAEQSLFRSLLSTPFQDQPGGNDARPAAATAANRTQMLPLVEHTAGFLTYRSADTAQSRICQQLALITLSNLTIIDPDGTPLLSRSPSLIPKLIIRLASDAAILYDGASSPSSGTHLEK